MEDVTCTKELRDCTSHNTGNWPEITSAHSSANKDISISNYNVIGHKQTSYNGHTGGDFADTVSCHLAASPHHPKTPGMMPVLSQVRGMLVQLVPVPPVSLQHPCGVKNTHIKRPVPPFLFRSRPAACVKKLELQRKPKPLTLNMSSIRSKVSTSGGERTEIPPDTSE